eukprot:NODE_99_length_20465_cov_0.827654.p9 type:complete len:213 gc:universal NODE_99_length_20465_cov_0.827654:7924-7286(-)
MMIVFTILIAVATCPRVLPIGEAISKSDSEQLDAIEHIVDSYTDEAVHETVDQIDAYQLARVILSGDYFELDEVAKRLKQLNSPILQESTQVFSQSHHEYALKKREEPISTTRVTAIIIYLSSFVLWAIGLTHKNEGEWAKGLEYGGLSIIIAGLILSNTCMFDSERVKWYNLHKHIPTNYKQLRESLSKPKLIPIDQSEENAESDSNGVDV